MLKKDKIKYSVVLRAFSANLRVILSLQGYTQSTVKFSYFVIAMLFCWFLNAYPQQIAIPRIEQMPNIPSPYLMRDWKKVAIGYDSLIYNFNATGDFLPLLYFNNNTVNYSSQQSFGLHTYVGTYSPTNGEAINILPSLVGATLVGIDKRNQNGFDWVKMSREYFNKRPEMNIYKNSPNDNSFDDWWYETMPNVFFYQLYTLYKNVEDYDYQFRTIADRFLEVVRLSGGGTTPWKIPDFNYRGWDFVNMQPYKIGVVEPEAAGAIGWILYNAYIQTGEKKYLIGAEWCMEYLNSLSDNPAYEIQLPYGVLTAARMNAEIGTDYDIEKMFGWCFSKTYLRNWNVLVGKWGVYDINGLIGEDSDRQYAFAMNTFQQIGALVPLVKYDERFANAIGKWVLNAANSLRFFYSEYIDNLHQSDWSWAKQYDPNSYISYEALLKTGSGWPYATGDAKSNGWARTNLSLYSSSSVGYLAALLDTTEIPAILKLDLNITDFFGVKSYPSYLLYNPYDSAKVVDINLPSGTFDIYESITNSFVFTNVSTFAKVNIPAQSSVILILIPSGSKIEYKLNKLLVNNIAVDYNTNHLVSNYPPRIKSLSALSSILLSGDSTKIYCTAVDKDNDQLSYTWKTSKGKIVGSGSIINFIADNDTGQVNITVLVDDLKGGKDSAGVIIKIVKEINHSPQINFLKAFPRKINLGQSTKIVCSAFDVDNDRLNFMWQINAGIINQISEDSVLWTAPEIEGDYFVKCTVDDSKGSAVKDSIKVMVRDFSKYQIGNLIAFYPFNGNANDESGNGNDGIVSGATFTNDRFNNPFSALSFDGIDDKVQIKNSAFLNFQNAITISFWMKLNQLPTKEVYIISHGSWDRRYKVSISSKKLRWTIKTDKSGNQILDLDSQSIIDANKLYHCVVIYTGSDAEIWLNGELDSFTSWSGKLLTSDVDLTIAQMLPLDANYNFKGVLDDIRIYDYTLLPQEIENLYDLPTSVQNNKKNNSLTLETKLDGNYPNPFNSSTQIIYKVSKRSNVKIYIYDILGRKIKSLLDDEKDKGIFNLWWDGKNDFGKNVSSGTYICIMKSDENISKLKLLLVK
ncbi:LamG-like jellyroll fold domain-containing protein [Melioribacteraceae bacterium 4301-Me]|uniref:LamG domain-containing protein n=1 Tax=Pyranulibacter aquaticus TaxID=3163344 RepID=UPI003597B049